MNINSSTEDFRKFGSSIEEKTKRKLKRKTKGNASCREEN